MDFFTLFYFLVLIVAVVIHEVSHGYAALLLGDTTAQDMGRLTLNPIKHIDMVGSIIVPIVSSILHVPFGWAKPVPFDPTRLSNRRWGEAIVAAAGPISNLILAIIFAAILRIFIPLDQVLVDPKGMALLIIVAVNVGLAVFNLIPIPPLDGSKILFAFIPTQYERIRRMIEVYQFALIILVLIVAPNIIRPILQWAVNLLTGIPLQF